MDWRRKKGSGTFKPPHPQILSPGSYMETPGTESHLLRELQRADLRIRGGEKGNTCRSASFQQQRTRIGGWEADVGEEGWSWVFQANSLTDCNSSVAVTWPCCCWGLLGGENICMRAPPPQVVAVIMGALQADSAEGCWETQHWSISTMVWLLLLLTLLTHCIG